VLVGINGRNDFWQGQFTESDYQVIREAKIEMVKLMEYTKLSVLNRLRVERPSIQFIIRLYEQGQKPGPPAEFVKQHANSIESFRLYTNLYEVLNEPNHQQEGWGPTLDQAKAFNQWFLETLSLLKARHPWAKFGFPALSPTMLPDDPHLDFDWLETCRPAIEAADWLGVHCYWFDEHGVLHPAFGLRFTQYHQRFPNKIIHITEFNSGPQMHPWLRAENYVKYYQEVAKYDYIASASSFIISSPDSQFHPLQWWEPNSGQLHPVAWQVGQIPRPLGPKPDERPLYAVDYVKHNTPDTMVVGNTVGVQMAVRNTSRKVWPEAGVNMVRLSYHWYTPTGDQLSPDLWTQHRARLPFDVEPEHSAILDIILEAPRVPGDYLLKWDMVEEFITWFAWQDVPTLDIPVKVISDPAAPPPPPTGQIKATASHNNVSQGQDNLNQALDNNPYTRWSTMQPQRPGMWFQLDLGRAQTVSQIQLDNANSPMDYPLGYIIKVSQNGQNWETIAENPQNDKPVNVVFTPRETRFIRIEQTGYSDRWWWSIHEIYVSEKVRVSGRASHNNVLVGADNVLQALDGDPLTRWSTRALQQPGQWFEVDLNTTRTLKRLVVDSSNSPNDYPRGYIISLSEDQRNWVEVARNGHNTGSLDISFSARPARFIRIEQTGYADRWWWSIHRVGIE
jgi:hypothetical protein